MARLTVIIAFFVAIVPVFARGDITLRAVPPVDVPVIEKKTLRVNVDLVFDQCPQEYWVYYNKEFGRLVVEFFGVHINAPSIKIRGTSIVADLNVVNSETTFALNKKSSQISMVMQNGWHYDSWIVGGKMLRLQLWMPLNPSRTLNVKKRNRFAPVLVISITAVSLVALAILGLTR